MATGTHSVHPRTAPHATRRRRLLATALLIALVATACSETSTIDKSASETSSPTTPETACTATSLVECAPEGTTIDYLMPDTPEVATGDPIRIGMINNSSGPAAAFPEIARAAEVGAEWVNAELGGIDGHPIEIVGCDVKFSAAGSQSCGQQMVQEGVPVVLGGIDIFGDGIRVLEDNGIPYVGGVPVSLPSVRSPISFQFSGGSWGMNLGFVYHITQVLHAERVSIIYGDFGSVADGAEWGRRALVNQGIPPQNVNMVKIPIVAEDLLTPLSAANETDPRRDHPPRSRLRVRRRA